MVTTRWSWLSTASMIKPVTVSSQASAVELLLQETNKSSIVFSLPHEEGSLSHVLAILSFYRINLTKIQSLPIIGREWEYLFYVDLMYDDLTRYRQSIDAIIPLTKDFKILGGPCRQGSAVRQISILRYYNTTINNSRTRKYYNK